MAAVGKLRAASRTPQGVRGLKLTAAEKFVLGLRRTPQGVRGLKCIGVAFKLRQDWSHPARGAWIEIQLIVVIAPGGSVAPRKGCVD